jgi:hypothetical protein
VLYNVRQIGYRVRFQVLMGTIMKITVSWDAAPCCLGGDYCLHYPGDQMMEAVSTPETSVNFYQTTRRNIPEDSHLEIGCRSSENPLLLYRSANQKWPGTKLWNCYVLLLKTIPKTSTVIRQYHTLFELK